MPRAWLHNVFLTNLHRHDFNDVADKFRCASALRQYEQFRFLCVPMPANLTIAFDNQPFGHGPFKQITPVI